MSARKPDEGRYSRISRRVWNSQDFRALSAPKPNAQTLWLRLLCGPELGSIPGLFEARESGMAEAMGWALPAFRRCLSEITDRGMAKFEKSAGLMWVPKSIRHNAPDNPNVIIGWRVAWKDLPECSLKHEAKITLKGWCVEHGESWAKAFAYAAGDLSANPFPKGSPKGSGKQDSENENDSDSDTNTEAPPVVVSAGKPEDPGRETMCPSDLLERLEKAGTVAALAEKLSTPIDSIRHEIRQFVAYWVIGKGAGQKRTGWAGKARQWVVEKHGKGEITAPGAVEHAGRRGHRGAPADAPIAPSPMLAMMPEGVR